MVRKTSLILLAAAFAAVVTAALAANAATGNDALAGDKASISLVQAITAAEQHHPGGRATRAEYEHSRRLGWTYDVEIVSGPQVFDVRIDPQKGTVLSSVEDKADRDREEDERS